MIMQCLCGGHYPSIEEQARRLHDEAGMPEWSLPIYIGLIETINLCLMTILIEAHRRNLRHMRGSPMKDRDTSR
jgi:hypothetical protein